MELEKLRARGLKEDESMWTREELKSRAKDCLRKYYWMAFLVSLIASLLGGGMSGGAGAGGKVNFSRGSGTTSELQGDVGNLLGNTNQGMVMAVIAIVLVVIVVMLIFGTLWSAFMGNVVEVGCCRYFMESRASGQSAGLGRLFWCFERGKYLNVVKVMFLKNLFIFLWTLVLIIPGIIKTYEYAMVPYILSENPNMDYRDALALSRQMMDGEKFNLFVLQWSFIGWELLGMLLCGIGILFVVPYENATFAELYAVLRKRPAASGAVLPGYGPEQETVYTDYTMY